MRAHAARSDRTGGFPARHGRRLARSAAEALNLALELYPEPEP
jgi:hypothetical protein